MGLSSGCGGCTWRRLTHRLLRLHPSHQPPSQLWCPVEGSRFIRSDALCISVLHVQVGAGLPCNLDATAPHAAAGSRSPNPEWAQCQHHTSSKMRMPVEVTSYNIALHDNGHACALFCCQWISLHVRPRHPSPSRPSFAIRADRPQAGWDRPRTLESHSAAPAPCTHCALSQ
jgi:hypothetical protein